MMSEKLKPILPSLREKKRYLAFEIISKEKIKDSAIVYNTLRSAAMNFMGEIGMSNAGMIMLSDKWDIEKQRGIVKVNHKYVDHLRAAITLITNIGNQQVIVRSVGVSGILKKAQNKYLAS